MYLNAALAVTFFCRNPINKCRETERMSAGNMCVSVHVFCCMFLSMFMLFFLLCVGVFCCLNLSVCVILDVCQCVSLQPCTHADMLTR